MAVLRRQRYAVLLAPVNLPPFASSRAASKSSEAMPSGVASSRRRRCLVWSQRAEPSPVRPINVRAVSSNSRAASTWPFLQAVSNGVTLRVDLRLVQPRRSTRPFSQVQQRLPFAPVDLRAFIQQQPRRIDVAILQAMDSGVTPFFAV